MHVDGTSTSWIADRLVGDGGDRGLRERLPMILVMEGCRPDERTCVRLEQAHSSIRVRRMVSWLHRHSVAWSLAEVQWRPFCGRPRGLSSRFGLGEQWPRYCLLQWPRRWAVGRLSGSLPVHGNGRRRPHPQLSRRTAFAEGSTSVDCLSRGSPFLASPNAAAPTSLGVLICRRRSARSS